MQTIPRISRILTILADSNVGPIYFETSVDVFANVPISDMNGLILWIPRILRILKVSKQRPIDFRISDDVLASSLILKTSGLAFRLIVFV